MEKGGRGREKEEKREEQGEREGGGEEGAREGRERENKLACGAYLTFSQL